jgi:AcrR family transcriptional regulator
MRPAATPLGRARWAGVPAEDRRSSRRAALVHAAFELLTAEGWPATTVRAVCAQARLNPRYFYESFLDLDGLVVAVYDQVVAELFERIRDARAAARPSANAQLRATVDATVGFVDEDRRRGRVLYVAALGSEALNQRRRETGQALVESLGRTGGDQATARARAAVLVGGFSELLVSWLDGRIDLTRAELVDEATALFSRLASTPGIGPNPRSGVEGRP